MRNLEELRKKVYPIPCLFAKESAATGGIAVNLDYNNGFKPVSEQTYIERKDINKFGELASLESHYVQAGGIHSYSTPISNNFGGYPERCLLYAYDGNYLHKVESTEGSNTKPFIDNAGNVIPYVIDCPVTKPNDTNITPRILWKSVGNIYGTNNGMFSLQLDYSRVQQLSSGSIVMEDSIVVGEIVAFVNIDNGTNITVNALPSFKHQTEIGYGINTISLEITNKGKFGDNMGREAVIFNWGITDGGTIISSGTEVRYLPVPALTGGTGNYALSFFAKKGTSFSGKGTMVFSRTLSRSDWIVKWTAIPIIPMVQEPESVEEEG